MVTIDRIERERVQRRIDGTDGLYGRPVMGATDRSSSNLSPSQNLMQSPCCLTNLAYHWH